jgi:hypothetical protein
MGADLFAGDARPSGASPLTVFRAELIGRDEATEIVFGSERILSKEHLALAQASQIVESYGFKDSLGDQKALVEALAGLLGRMGGVLLGRVASGSLRFRLLKGKPSHEKLYLLSRPDRQRVIAGSANLSLAAFAGRQAEILTVFDGTVAWELFAEHYHRDCQDSVPVDADLLVLPAADGAFTARTSPLALEEVPIVRALDARVAVVDAPPAAVPVGFGPETLRAAAALGAELRNLNLPKDKNGCSVVNAASVLRVFRAHRAQPVADTTEDRIPRAEIDVATGIVSLNGEPWLGPNEPVPAAEVARDAKILVDYIGSFGMFFGNAHGAIDAYWAFLVWLYAAPVAPHLRQAAVPAGLDPWLYPVYAVLYGRSSGGKTVFTKIAARSMFGFEKMVRSGKFTANKALGLRDRLGAIPLLVDDLTRDKFMTYVPDLVRTDHEVIGRYAPIVLTTNRDASAIPPDLTKRMVTCHIDAAIPENRAVGERIARTAQREIGTALYRAYLQHLLPAVRSMRAAIVSQAEEFPDLLRGSAAILRSVVGDALGDLPSWARPLAFDDYFGIRHRRFRDQLRDMLDGADDRISVNRPGNELVISFGGDTNQAAQFARSVPDFALKERFADRVKLDLSALEQVLGFSRPRNRWWQRPIGR